MMQFLLLLFHRISPILFVRIVLVLMFFIPGLLALYVGLAGSSWFFTSRTAQYFKQALGEKGARILYVILGLLLIACGVVGVVDPSRLMPHN